MTWRRCRNPRARSSYQILAEQASGAGKKALLDQAREAASVALKQGKVYLPGLPEALMLNGRLLWLLGNKMKARQALEQSRARAEVMNVGFDLGRTLLELGRRTGDKEQLDRSIEIFTQIGSRWELARAKEIRARANHVNG